MFAPWSRCFGFGTPCSRPQRINFRPWYASASPKYLASAYVSSDDADSRFQDPIHAVERSASGHLRPTPGRYPSTDFRFAPVATVRRRDGEAEGPRLGEECAIGDHRVEGAAQRREPLRPFANVARVT